MFKWKFNPSKIYVTLCKYTITKYNLSPKHVINIQTQMKVDAVKQGRNHGT